MKKIVVEEILKERLESNNSIFKTEEINNILKNMALHSKVYLLGMLDVKM